MHVPNERRNTLTLLFVITLIPAVLLASFFLFMGAVDLVQPDVPKSALAESTLVDAMLILTAAVLIYALFSPYSGGFCLCVCTVPFAFVFNAFHLSDALYPVRQTGYADFWSAVAGFILLLGVLFVLRGRLCGRTATEKPAQPS
jgi:hypothetical protein